MRGKKAALNSITALLAQCVSIICGFILPKLILSHFGSSYNGITSSISQFISCAVLLRAGIGSVTRAALYKPLAEGNNREISGIVNATDKYMKHVALIFAAMLIAFAGVFPFVVSDEFDWLFSFSLVLILGISTFAQNYFGITYQMLIQADQRQYIYSAITIATTILNTLIASLLIEMDFSIHTVKLGSAIVFALNPIILNLYVRKKYSIDKKVPANESAISQRWDAFAQQAAAFVNNNTDVMILTIWSNLKEVSVYTVYYLVANGLYKLEYTISESIEAAFGNMIAKGEKKSLDENVKLVEFAMFSSAAFLFICGGNLIVPFVKVYTSGVGDVSYDRPLFGMLICLNQFLACIRLPYQMLVEASGHFKQTKNGAIFEAVMNIIVSIILVRKFGLIGVAIGTTCALSFRTIQYAGYSSKNILNRSIKVVLKNLIIAFCEAAMATLVIKAVPVSSEFIGSYGEWILYALYVAMVTGGVVVISSILFYRNELKKVAYKLKKTGSSFYRRKNV